MNPTLITVGAFLAISLVLYVIGRLVVGAGRKNLGEHEARPLALGILTLPVSRMLPRTADRELRQDLRRAGLYHPLALEEFLAVRNALVLGWLAVCGAAYWLIVREHPHLLIWLAVAGIVVLIVFYSIPRLVLQAQASARLQRIERSLPDGLDMMTMVMEGGLALVAALEHVAREIAVAHPDLACELTLVARHTKARSLDHALRQFAERIDTPDVQSLSALVSHAEQLGSNVAGAFREFADSIRRGHRQRAEERGNKASVKLLFPVVLCLAPPVYILLLAPALLELRSFVLRENRPGGVLSQDTMGTVEGPLTPSVQENVLFRPAPPQRPR